jgi:hypothetical protein
MYTSLRGLTPPAPRPRRQSLLAHVLSVVRLPDVRAVAFAAGLVVYLATCLSAGLARRATRSLGARVRGALNEQRRVRRILITAGIFGVAIIFGASASGSTLALWNASTPIGAASISTGSTGITVNGSTTYTVPGLTTTQLLPGLTAVSPQVLTIKNSGNTTLSIAVGAVVFGDPTSLLAQNSNLAVSLFQSTSCAQSVDGSSATPWTTAIVVAPGGTISACLQMTLSATAPSTVQGLSATFTLPVVGTQTRNNP